MDPPPRSRIQASKNKSVERKETGALQFVSHFLEVFFLIIQNVDHPQVAAVRTQVNRYNFFPDNSCVSFGTVSQRFVCTQLGAVGCTFIVVFFLLALGYERTLYLHPRRPWVTINNTTGSNKLSALAV